jgi:phosphoglycerol transferase MdoB-like AlkP superfamily enzyme
VIKNLIYYQTNYFALAATIFTLFGLFHPFKILVGISLLVAIAFGVYRLGEETKKKDPVQLPNKWAILGGNESILYSSICFI